MKKIIFVAIISLLFASCKKEDRTIKEPQLTTLVSGNFISSVHTTTGAAKIVRDSANKLKLVLENFRTDNGPDLRVWLSSNIAATDYTEAGILNSVEGNFSFSLPDQFNYSVKKNVLIWCEDFSVLFGYATLQ